jgi:hypothetical protein
MQIPFYSKSENGQPLLACIRRPARAMGMSEYTVALVMSYFFEALVDETCRSKVVRIPGIGIFAPKAWFPRKAGVMPRCYPSFSACLGYRQQMACCCSVSDCDALLAIDRHRRSNFDLNQFGKTGRRAWMTQQAFRRHVRAQGHRLGHEFDDDVHDNPSPD